LPRGFNYKALFARWHKLGEKFDQDWCYSLDFGASARVVAISLWSGVMGGSCVVWLLNGLYIASDSNDELQGPYKTFEESAVASEAFWVTSATETISVDPRMLAKRRFPRTPPRSESRSVVSSRGSQKWSKELITAWESAAQDFRKQMRASGRAVRVVTGPLGRKFFVATFPRLTGEQAASFQIVDTWNRTKR
jgi:hypothetical protein